MVCWHEPSFLLVNLMKLRSTLGGRLNSILYLLQRNSALVESFSTRVNLTRQPRLGAKLQSCSHPLLPVIGGRCSSLCSAAMAKRPYGKLNWSLTTAFVFSNSHSRYHVRGERDAADAALGDLIAHSREGLAYQIAQVYAVRGEVDKAFEWLQIAFDNHDGGIPSLSVDPLLRGLRGDSRYKAMLEKVGLPGSL